MNDGSEFQEYDYLSNLTYSPDGKSFAYMAKTGNQWMIIKDRSESQKYDEVSGLTYSSDGKSFAYKAKIGDKYIGYLSNKITRSKKQFNKTSSS